MATDFFVYYSDGVDAPPSPFVSEVQTLIPVLDAEDGGAATVTVVNRNAGDPVVEGHQGPDVLGNSMRTSPAIVAERSGKVVRVYNVDTAGDLAITVVDPGEALASDTLDTLETQTLAEEQVEADAEERSEFGTLSLQECEGLLLGGDILTPDAERGCFANLVRSQLNLPLTDTKRFIAETEIDIEGFASDLDGVDDVGTGGASQDDSIKHPDIVGNEGFVRKVGLKAYQAVKSNLEAAAAPLVTDDETEGYGLWSTWIYSGTPYLCLDPSAGAADWQALGTPGGGEANDGANVGAGAQIYRDKTGVLINFRTITTPDDKLSAVVDGDEIELGLGADLVLNDIPDVEITTPQSGQVLTLVECPPGTFAWVNMAAGGSGGSGGFVVDAQNVGAGGVGVFKTKNGSTLEFKKINAKDAKITVTDDVGNNEVDIGLGVVPINALSDVDTDTDAPMTGDPLVWDGAQWVPESAFPGASVRDRQFAQANDAPTTTSGTFVDMPDMLITTSNATPLNYVATWSAEIENSNSNRTMDFQIVVDGAAKPESLRSIKVPGSNSPRPVSLTTVLEGVDDAKDIKVQWRTDGGTMTVRGRTLIADGEP